VETAQLDVIVRDARPEELDQAAAVMLAAYQEYAPLFPQRGWEAYARDIVDVHGRAPDAELIVAERDGRIVGAVTYYPDGSRSVERWPEGWAGIRLLGVDPTARGLRIGRLLTEECLRRSHDRGIRTIALHTTAPMAVARAMYERMGFVRAPEFDLYPRPDFVIMAYRLDLEP
jgi:ribosomal protein S18 acetylase RimI-like enzyme